jgi:hypothetical protein
LPFNKLRLINICKGVPFEVSLGSGLSLVSKDLVSCIFLTAATGLEYVWLWTALLTSFGLYSSVAFIVYRQHVLADNSSMVSDSRGKEIRKLALQMVL